MDIVANIQSKIDQFYQFISENKNIQIIRDEVVQYFFFTIFGPTIFGKYSEFDQPTFLARRTSNFHF